MNKYNSKYTFKLTHNDAVRIIQEYYESFSDISILSITSILDLFVVSKLVLYKGKELIVNNYISCYKLISILKNALIFKGYDVDNIKVDCNNDVMTYKIDINLVDVVRTRHK